MNRRFFCEHIPNVGDTVELSPDESHHVRDVLRGRSGETLQLLDGDGTMADAVIAELGARKRPVVCTVQSREHHSAPTPRLQLFVAPNRSKGMVAIIRSATELGVARIVPTICEGSEAKPDNVSANWIAAAQAACKQSGNLFCPSIDTPLKLGEVFDRESPRGYIGWVPQDEPNDTSPTVAAEPIALFIGPEAGYSDSEIQLLRQHGLLPLRLGPWVLRVETAVVAGLAWLNQRYCL